jgi:hypothetical protein
MDIQFLSPAEIYGLRKQGIRVVAEAAGSVPGVVHPVKGGIRTLHGALSTVIDVDWLDVLAAVAWVETKGDAMAVSPTGALGLFQLTQPIWWETEPALNPFDWRASSRRARDVLEGYFNRAEGSSGDPLGVALRAYKEGWVGAKRHPDRAATYHEAVLQAMASLG